MNDNDRVAEPGGLFKFRVIATVLLPFGCGYFLSYLYRTVNVVLAPRLATDLALSAADLGFLTSLYFIVFAAFQTPLGILLDRYGPRRVQGGLLLFAAMGSALFAVSDNFVTVSIGRGLIGLGVSGCLMGALKANVLWFPVRRLPLVNSITVAFGSFGALVGTIPVEMAVGMFGWRAIFAALAVVTVVVAILTVLIIPEKPGEDVSRSSVSWREQFRNLRMIYGNPFFWRLCVIVFMQLGVYMAYQALWLGPWLRDVAGMSPGDVAASLFLFNCGMFAGVLGIGVLADRLQSFGVQPIVVFGAGMVGSLLVQLLLALEVVSLARPLCVALGFFGSASVLVYSILARRFPAHLIGRVNTASNMLTFIAAFAVQWGVGVVINRWPGTAGGGYDPSGHQAALLGLLAIEVMAFVYFLWPRRHSSLISGE
ncbi:MAG: MFS transporter [Alphaproteobacteria bacterium]